MINDTILFSILFMAFIFGIIPLLWIIFRFFLKRHCLNCVEEQKYELFDIGGDLFMDTMKLGSKL